MPYFAKILPLGAAMIRATRKTGVQTDMTMLIDDFRNLSERAQTCIFSAQCIEEYPT